MNIAVCGGKDLKDAPFVQKSLDFWRLRLPISTLIVGGQVTLDPAEKSISWEQRAKWGADWLAKDWAERSGIPVIEVTTSDADWKRLGARAEQARIERFLKQEPKRLIVLSAGAEELVGYARAAGVKCIEVA